MIAWKAAARWRRCPDGRSIGALPIWLRRSYGLSSSFLNVSEEIQDAVAAGKPVIALESTIYTHGFPYPDNVVLASLLESLVRTNGGVPATIAVFNGVARIGLEPEELIELASTAKTKSALKVSRRDLGYICGRGLAGNRIHGGTTISGTMILAHLAGIKIFGTGGLGGVHRGGEVSMDISADLTELGRTPVTVISSGCKSFLDIPRTLEYLETQGVCVGTFADGRKGPVDFPAFFSRESGVRSPRVIQDEAEAAAIVHAQLKLPLSSGIHFANPVPEQHSIPKCEMDKIIAEALRCADLEGFHGSDNTPYVLSKIKELSGSRSVVANKGLIESNVKRATKVAVELMKLEQPSQRRADQRMPVISTASSPISTTPALKEDTKIPKLYGVSDIRQDQVERANILVAGAVAIDSSCDYAPVTEHCTNIAPVPQTSNPAIIKQNLGGVGHNVALAASYVGSSVVFCSVVADDLSGQTAISMLKREKLSTMGIQILPPMLGLRTAQYIAVNDRKKDLVLAMADMGILELSDRDLNFDTFWDPIFMRTKPKWLVIDANWSPGVLARWVASAKRYGARIAFEPVSTAKAKRIFSKISTRTEATAVIGFSDSFPNHLIDVAAPNNMELASMYSAARDAGLFDSPGWWHVIDGLGMSNTGSREQLISVTSKSLVDQGVPQQSIQLLPFIPFILTKLGSQGVLVSQLLQPDDPRLTCPDAAPYILGRASRNGLVGGVYLRLFAPDQVLTGKEVVSVNGAGDTLLGVAIAGLAREPGTKDYRLENIISVAQKASVKTLKSPDSVNADIRSLAMLLK